MNAPSPALCHLQFPGESGRSSQNPLDPTRTCPCAAELLSISTQNRLGRRDPRLPASSSRYADRHWRLTSESSASAGGLAPRQPNSTGGDWGFTHRNGGQQPCRQRPLSIVLSFKADNSV